MPRKTVECPTCGASLPAIKGEFQSCPECGMPLDVEYEPEEKEEEETEEESDEEEEWE